MADKMFEGLVNDFVLESQERIERVEENLLKLEETAVGGRQDIINTAKRELHTLKGNSGMMGFKNLQTLSHRLEDMVVALSLEDPDIEKMLAGLDVLRKALEHVRNTGTDILPEQDEAGMAKAKENAVTQQMQGEGEQGQGSVRVSFAALDELVDLLAQMVIFRNRLADAVARGRTHQYNLQLLWGEVENAQEDLGKALSFIHDRVMHLRMVPLQTLFKRLKRIVHDESVKEGKKVNFEVTGGETPLDKALLELASVALGHLVRNSVIHGLERPAERVRNGKSDTGTVKISAQLQSGEVFIDVVDDGQGIDEQRLLEKAVEKGVDISQFESVFDVLFLAGFTTKQSADMSAGRGIGLSAVLEAVQHQGGRVEVTTEKGKGTRFRMKLPRSVSITRALIFEVDKEEYAIPMQNIVESMHYREGDGHVINSAGVYKWRGEVIPVIDIGYIAGTTLKNRDSGYIIIIEADQKKRGLLVDTITGIRDIVVKSLDPLLEAPKWVSGATIRGDGTTQIILDSTSLIGLKPFVEKRENLATEGGTNG